MPPRNAARHDRSTASSTYRPDGTGPRPKNRRTELRIADFKSALKIAPAKTDGNFIVKRAAVFYWLIGIVISAIAIAISFHFDGAMRDFMAQHQTP